MPCPRSAECRDGSRLFNFAPALRGDDDETHEDLAAAAHEELRVRGLLPPDTPVAAPSSPVDSSSRPATSAAPTVHFVGIGGVGLAALARLALADVRALPSRETLRVRLWSQGRKEARRAARQRTLGHVGVEVKSQHAQLGRTPHTRTANAKGFQRRRLEVVLGKVGGRGVAAHAATPPHARTHQHPRLYAPRVRER